MSRLYPSILLLTIIVLAGVSCRNDFEFTPSTGQLEFSRDTVYLNSVFTDIGSSTKNFKVYNRSSNDIVIPKVQLEQGENSDYRLNIDGRAGKVFDNVEVLAKDSIFVFVETTIDISEVGNNSNEFLYTDRIVFDEGNDQQDVDLVALVKDAVFLFPERSEDGTIETLLLGMDEEGNEIRVEGFILEDNELTFTNEKPYVIYGYAGISDEKTLTVDAGARVHFHDNSGIIVGEGGTLRVMGEASDDPELLENEVIFQGDRLEPEFENVAAQWSTLWLSAGSTNNEINHATIKNALWGLRVDGTDGSANPTLKVDNTQIYNSGSIGLLAQATHIEGENLVVANAALIALYCNIGGTYNFKHCTFANYWQNSFRNIPAVVVTNFTETSDGQLITSDLVAADFSNSIIYGNNNIELLLEASDQSAFNYTFRNTLLRFDDSFVSIGDGPLYDFDDPDRYQNILLNMAPSFKDPQNNEFFIGDDSPAKGQGDTEVAQQVPLDLLGVSRIASPDLGAYQTIIFPED